MILNSLLSVLAAVAVQSNPLVVVSPQSWSPPGYAAARSLASSAFPKTYKFLVVPVRFQGYDTTFSVDSLSTIFDGNSPFVTVRRFYQEQSNGKIDMTFKFLPWMLSSVPRDSLGYGIPGKDPFQSKIVEEVAAYSIAAGQNLSDYDNDQDGKLDGLIVLFSGHGFQETQKATDPSPAMVTFGDSINVAPGLSIVRSLQLIEVDDSQPLRQGVIAHEIGHILGASDMYDQNQGAQGEDGGLGSWDVMSHGGYGRWWVSAKVDPFRMRKPSGFSAFTRWQLGWIQLQEIDANQEVRLKPGQTARLWVDSLRTSEYLLLENRDRSGVDSVLPGPGLSVFRVRRERIILGSSLLPQDVNSDSSVMGVELLEASGLQRTSRSNGWVEPLSSDLFGIASDSLTDNGPVSLKRSNGASTGAWLRQIRVDGNDVVFRANPVQQRGYGLETGNGALKNRSIENDQFTVLVPMQISATGRVVAMTSVLPANASKICVGIWDTMSRFDLGTPLATACDSGGFANRFRMFHHDLSQSISVKAGQTIWVGQTINPSSGLGNFAAMSVDPDIDTTWIFQPGIPANLITVRPLIGLLIQTDSITASVLPALVTSNVAIRCLGGFARLDGAQAGETVRLVLRDLRGRTLWSTDVACDAAGSARIAIARDGSGLRILEAKGSFGMRTLVLPRP